MKPVDPSVYRAALDRLDIFKKALVEIANYAPHEVTYARDKAREALATVAEADRFDAETEEKHK